MSDWWGLFRQLVGELRYRCHHFLRTFLNFLDHHASLIDQLQYLLGLLLAALDDGDGIGGQRLVLADHADYFLGRSAGA